MVRTLQRLVESGRRFAQTNPYWWALICFAIIDSPQWLNATWGLYSSEPLLQHLRRYQWSGLIPTFSPYLVTVPVGVTLMVLTWYVGRRSRLLVTYTFENHGGYLLVTNPPRGRTVRGVRAEYVKIDPSFPNRHLVLPAPLRMAHGPLEQTNAEVDFDLPPGRSRSLLVCDLGGQRVHSAYGFEKAIIQVRTIFTVAVTGDAVSPVTIEFAIDPPPIPQSAQPRGIVGTDPELKATPAGLLKPAGEASRVVLELKMVPNGLLVNARNTTPDVLRAVRLCFVGLTRYSEQHRAFIADRQCEVNGAFPPIDLGGRDIYPTDANNSNDAVEFGFTDSSDPDSIRFPNPVVIRTPGTWRATFRLEFGESNELVDCCFSWRPRTAPIPVSCPQS